MLGDEHDVVFESRLEEHVAKGAKGSVGSRIDDEVEEVPVGRDSGHNSAPARVALKIVVDAKSAVIPEGDGMMPPVEPSHVDGDVERLLEVAVAAIVAVHLEGAVAAKDDVDGDLVGGLGDRETCD